MELNRAVAENIKRIRKSKKLSMERLAAEAGVSRSMLGQIERGEANPSVAILGKLAGALKVPAEVLLENDDFVSLAQYREVDTKPVRLDGRQVRLYSLAGNPLCPPDGFRTVPRNRKPGRCRRNMRTRRLTELWSR